MGDKGQGWASCLRAELQEGRAENCALSQVNTRLVWKMAKSPVWQPFKAVCAWEAVRETDAVDEAGS